MTDAQIERLDTYLQLGFDVWWRDGDRYQKITHLGITSDPPGDPEELVACLDGGGYIALAVTLTENIHVTPRYTPKWPDDDVATAGWMIKRFGREL